MAVLGPGELWKRAAAENNGRDYARSYAAHFDRLVAEGQDVHGEAAFLARNVAAGSRVLDAGCGTGRIAARLKDLGYDVVGVDVDEAMVSVARERRPDIEWRIAGLAEMDLGPFEGIIIAGNVIPFVEVETFQQVAANLAAHLAPGAALVMGFGLDRDHLPPGATLVDFEHFLAVFAEAGLQLSARFGGWSGEGPVDGYVVAVFTLE